MSTLPANQTRLAQARADLADLCGVFADDLAFVESCDKVSRDELPDPFDRLLAHREHMTTTLGDYYGKPVELRVLDERRDNDTYARMILLHLPGGTPVVEFGIARVHLRCTPVPVRREILQRRTPLGDILIAHRIMRRIEPRWFFRFPRDLALLAHFDDAQRARAYGRVGRILFHDEPAIDLLEIVVDARGGPAQPSDPDRGPDA